MCSVTGGHREVVGRNGLGRSFPIVPCSHAHMLKRSTPAIADDTLFTDILSTALIWCRLTLSTNSASALRSSPCRPATPDLYHSFNQLFSCRFQAQAWKSRKRGSQWDYRSFEVQDGHASGEFPSNFIIIHFANQNLRSELRDVAFSGEHSQTPRPPTFTKGILHFFQQNCCTVRCFAPLKP